MRGGSASDWRSTVMSRGPGQLASAGNMSKQMFNQFTDAEYIPNDMLAYYAAPKSTGFEASNTTMPCAMPTKLL
tara:strand:- start:285 stop:506 length:222 start_codon:yes stop_codon:yes gene_type:complete